MVEVIANNSLLGGACVALGSLAIKPSTTEEQI
jgi:hypothetical protein